MRKRRIELIDAQTDNVDAGILNVGDLRKLLDEAKERSMPPDHPPAPWFDTQQFQAAKNYGSAETAHHALAKLMKQGIIQDRPFRLRRHNRPLEVRCYRTKPTT